MAKAHVYITYKNGVLDPQGEAVKDALSSLGFQGVGDVRVGKYIEIEVEKSAPDEIRDEVEKMCQELLANPIIEDFRVEIPAGNNNSQPPKLDA